MIIGNKKFENYTYVMAIINLTPDSFYSASRTTCDDVLFRTERAIKDGAAIIDLGAQSTRPSYKEVPPEEELARLEKPLTAILKNFDIPVSVDTYFPMVAKAAFDMGAHLLNDIWGLTAEGMAQLVADANGSVCIMHNAKSKLEGEIFPQIENFLRSSVQKALDAGVDKDKICLDGGIGFAKDKEQNWQLLNGYGRLNKLGYPLLLGTSRKSMFGGNVEDRLQATVESTRLAVKDKVLFVRVHDVKENVQAIKEEYERN
ncbi:MAG: dihydropteroate synthase [Candidatus Coproplasma sp.]